MLHTAAWILHGAVTFFFGMLVSVALGSGGNWFMGLLGFVLGAGLYWFVIVSLLFVWLTITKELEGDTDGL
jgi:hypothetical protein